MVTKLNATDCWRHAAECEVEAARTNDPIVRDYFLEIADRWHRIANTFAYIDLRRPKPEGDALSNPQCSTATATE
jgi:hypothetical protein